MNTTSTPLVSIVTPTVRGVKELTQLLRDFRNQTLPKSAWEHIIVFDGTPPQDVVAFVAKMGGSHTKLVSIKKDMGDMRIAPGTIPRNHGAKVARGQFIVFCDDDDRYKDRYVETLLNGAADNALSVTQMTCQLSRMFRDGDPEKWVLVPEVGFPGGFPRICHVGTPCVMMPRKWVIETPWQHEPEHDFRLFKRLVEKYNPEIHFMPGMYVDVDGVVLRGLKDWVSMPPFYRG